MDSSLWTTIIEAAKDTSAALGLILSISSVCALFSKRIKRAIGNFFKKYGSEDDIAEIKKSLEEIKEHLVSIDEANGITVDFTREQCRSLIKDMFYKYHEQKKLPLYEYKLLLLLEDFYVRRLHGNTFVIDLIKKMKTWEIDYNESHLEEDV